MAIFRLTGKCRKVLAQAQEVLRREIGLPETHDMEMALLLAYLADPVGAFDADDFIEAGRNDQERVRLHDVLDRVKKAGLAKGLDQEYAGVAFARGVQEPIIRTRRVDARELARLRGMKHVNSVHVAVARDRLPHHHVGRSLLFDSEEIRKWYAAGGRRKLGAFRCEICRRRRGLKKRSS